jgi:flagellin
MSRINTNVGSLIAQTRLTRSQDQLQESLTRLSTGLRINSGKDDPAGLIASESLRADITATSKAISNSERANQLISTADSALGQISNLLNDVRGLVTEAANKGVLSDDQVAANQLQVDSSLEAIDRISQVTTFQGRKLLDGSLDFLTNVTSGGSSISDLNIQQANLGASGSVNVSVDVTAAAQQALITNSAINYSAGVKSAGTITFSDTAAVQGSAAVAFTGGNITVSAVAGGAADGSVADTTSIVIANSTGIAQATTATPIALTGGGLNISAVADGAADGVKGNSTDLVLQTATHVQATGTYALTNSGGGFDITAVAGSAADGTAGNGLTIVIADSAAPTSASYDAGTNTITVNADSGGTTIADISNAINTLAEFDTSAVTGGASSYNNADNGTQNNQISGGTNGTTTAAYNATTNTLTVSAALGATISDLATAISTDLSGDFTATASSGGTNVYDHTDNGTTTDPLSGGLDGAATAASYNSTTNVITVTAAANATLGDITTAINGLTDFNATTTDTSVKYDHADNGTKANALGTNGADATDSDVITITSNTTGTAYNGTLTFAKSNSVAAGAVDVQTSGSNITVTVNDNSAYDLDTLATSIQSQLSGYTVAVSATAGNGTYSSATDITPVAANLTGGTDDGGTGLAAAVTFKLSGSKGAEVFDFNAGSKLADVVTAINLVKDATGVEATNNAGTLELRSTEYGSAANVDVEVISEGAGGTFKASLSANRDTGTDIAATVNGIQANGKGNTISLNTASLDLDLTVANGSSTDIAFSVNGGGALFQLGPDVVTNQQARIGISSVNTAKLGGVSGRLYELRSGNSADLASDTSKAANIVDEVINKVTSLRGRLGAFQSTTLDSNIASLNDTMLNLTAAQSSIRDADFAAESAKLTRAQILTQAGTSVLQIANQAPQSVLSLLRG